MNKKKVVLPGGSGFLGQSLSLFLIDNNYEVVVLTRGNKKVENGVRYVHWDGYSLDKEWTKEIDGAYGVINFTGKSVNCIYTKENKEKIIKSRIHSVDVLHQAIQECNSPPQAFIQAGSLAIFGNTTELCNEDSPLGTGFSVDVCKEWEKCFFDSKLPNTRQIILRIGFALGKNGGALEPLTRLAKMNLGGTVGSGKQYISWLHVEDLNRMFLFALENQKTEGVYNATGPNPVTNKEFMKALRSSLGKGWSPPAPSPFVWIGAYLFMKTEPSLALTGRNCFPKKLLAEGFNFKHNDLLLTLNELTQ